MSNLADDIRTLVGLQLGIADVELDQTLISDLGAASTDIVSIAVAIEDKFRIELDESVLANIRTVADLVAAVDAAMPQP